jgi:hypothetical protein
MKRIIAGIVGSAVFGVLAFASSAGACPSQVTEQGGTQLQGYNNSAGCPVPSAGQCGTPAQAPYSPHPTYVGTPSQTPTTNPCPPKQTPPPPPVKKPCPTTTTVPPTTTTTPVVPPTTQPTPPVTPPTVPTAPVTVTTAPPVVPAGPSTISVAAPTGQTKVVPTAPVANLTTGTQLAHTGVNVLHLLVLALLVLALGALVHPKVRLRRGRPAHRATR